jgi:hypothetical protein
MGITLSRYSAVKILNTYYFDEITPFQLSDLSNWSYDCKEIVSFEAIVFQMEKKQVNDKIVCCLKLSDRNDVEYSIDCNLCIPITYKRRC